MEGPLLKFIMVNWVQVSLRAGPWTSGRPFGPGSQEVGYQKLVAKRLVAKSLKAAQEVGCPRGWLMSSFACGFLTRFATNTYRERERERGDKKAAGVLSGHREEPTQGRP